MRILVDIDGVLAEQVQPALDKYNAERGTTVLRSQIVTYHEPIGDTNIGAIISANAVDDLPVIDGARECMAELCQRHHVMIVTCRPVAMIDATKRWLTHNGIAHHSWAFVTDKADMPGDVLIDDYTGHCAAFARTGRRAILFDQPWNECDRAPDGVTRCVSWKHVLRQIDQWSTEVRP